jgi:hypothetical protein
MIQAKDFIKHGLGRRCWAVGVAQVLKHPSNKCKVLSLTPVPPKKKKNFKKNIKKKVKFLKK